MPPVYQFYLDHLARETGYRGAWQPNNLLYIGAVVKIESGVFSIMTDLQKEGIPFEVMGEEAEGLLDYSSSASVKINTKLKGKAPLAGSALSKADAGFNISFSGENAVAFFLDHARIFQIVNIAEIEKAVLERVREERWPKEWLIVTQLVRAGTATIIISCSVNSTIDLKASANIESGDLKLTDASLGLSVVNEEGRHLKFIAADAITPLYRVMGYRHPLFGRGQLSTRNRGWVERTEMFQIQPWNAAEMDQAETDDQPDEM